MNYFGLTLLIIFSSLVVYSASFVTYSYMDGHSKRGSFVFLLEFTPDDPAGLLSR